MYICAYFLEQINKYRVWTDTNYIVERSEKLIDGIVKNAARAFSAWRVLIDKVNPQRVIVNQMLRICNIDMEGEPVVDNLISAIHALKRTDKNLTTDPEYFKHSVDKLNQAMSDLERRTLQKYNEKIEKGKSPLKVFGKDVKVAGKDINIVTTDIIFERLLKFQKAMMLSSPATWGRNKLSNIILGGFKLPKFVADKVGKDYVGGMNDLSDVIGKLVPIKSKATNQYDLANVKVSKETAEFVQKWLIDTDLLNLVNDGLSKYDPRKKSFKSTAIDDVLTQMIADSVANRVINQHTFGKGKFTTWFEKSKFNKSGKPLEHGVMDNIINFIFDRQADKTDITRKALRYIGKMLQVDNIDLTNGVDANVMKIIADGYTMAAWEYMHRGNFLADFMHNLHNKHPKVYYTVSLVEPFLTSSWNWFTEMLQMNPIALGKNLYKLSKLEKVVNSLDERKRRGDYSVPNSRFAEMLVRRDIGKGVVGTVLMALGMALRAFGKIDLDDEDDKLKLKINNSWIDIDNVFGSSAILVGAQITKPTDGDWLSIIESAFNQQFDDSALTDLMNSFRYDSTPWDYLTSLPTTVVSGFVPNIYKALIRATNNHSVNYSKGILGNIEYFCMQTIPFFEYAMPKSINPYTGEWEEKYSIPAIHQLVNIVSPITFKTYDMDEVEKIFVSVGLKKGELTGEYKETGKLDKTLLNQYYGKLNNKTVKDFKNNKTKHTVEDKDGKRVELYYKDMTTEQRKSTLNSITTQNAMYAKIYVWTKSGHKYYCSTDVRTKLIQLGITENVFIGNKGFVK